MSGDIADFNLWDYEMTASDVLNLGCGARGNVINLDTLTQVGLLPSYNDSYQCADASSSQNLLKIQTSVPATFFLTATVEDPHIADSFLAITSTNELVRLRNRFDCDTLVGSNLSLGLCSYRRNCVNDNSSIRLNNTVQLFYHKFHNTETHVNIYVLKSDKLWSFDVSKCESTEIISFPADHIPKYMTSACECESLVEIVFDIAGGAYVWRVNVDTHDRVDAYIASTFMSGYRLPVSNVDCTKVLEVAISDTMDNVLDYVWAGSEVIYHDSVTGRLTQKRKLNEPISVYYSGSGEEYTEFVTFINPAYSSQDLVMADINNIHLVELGAVVTPPTADLSNPAYCVEAKYGCSGTLRAVYHYISSIEGCCYKCVRNTDCLALSYYPNKTCNICVEVNTKPMAIDPAIDIVGM